MSFPVNSQSILLITTGGTIAMDSGDVQTDPCTAECIEKIGFSGSVKIQQITNLPSVQMELSTALEIVRCATEVARAGTSVVVTHGTDVLEEVALLCDLIYDGQAPIIFTGAMRSVSAPGADGPANLHDAIVAAGSVAVRGCGAVVCFAGQLHAARFVRKEDSVGPDAFSSLPVGPLGFVREKRAMVLYKPKRYPAIDIRTFSGCVEILTVGLGSDGRSIDAVRASGVDGLVLVVPGAGHLPPPVLARLAVAAEQLPVVICVRPRYGTILQETYSFLGSETDLRQTNAIFAGSISPQAARIVLLAGLSSNMCIAELKAFFSWATI